MWSRKKPFKETIRWKGEIYCEACGSTLKRISATTPDYSLPCYDPMTGRKLTESEKLGREGLMVCSGSVFGSDFAKAMLLTPDFLRDFQNEHRSRHSMYYVDQPSL